MSIVVRKAVLTKKIILVGCGNIGSRHLQSLMKFQESVSIDIVEPNYKSKNNANALIGKIRTKKSPIITWFDSIQNLKNPADLVIIATNSRGRIELVDILLKQGNKKFLMEKLVCQSKKEYQSLISKLKRYDAHAWVNANRRYFNSYQKIKKIFKNSNFLQINVYLGNSGLGTASIHYIDLFCWLTDDYQIKLDGKYLMNKIFSNKRGRNFKEFAGTVIGSNSSGSLLTITTPNDQKLPPLSVVEIFDGKWHLAINELEEKFYYLSNFKKSPKISFKFNHVSELTYKIVQDIFKTNSCILPTLEDSFHAHLELFRIFNKHLSKHFHYKAQKCPIT
jgi:hypothetical protein